LRNARLSPELAETPLMVPNHDKSAAEQWIARTASRVHERKLVLE
jgi:hypothetical protein